MKNNIKDVVLRSIEEDDETTGPNHHRLREIDPKKTSSLVPKITQPWKVPYDTWLERNDEILASMVLAFLDRLEGSCGTPCFDARAAMDLFLRFAYKSSTSSFRSVDLDQRIEKSIVRSFDDDGRIGS